MALVVNTNIVNQASGYSVDDKSVKGGPVIVDTLSDLSDPQKVPVATTVLGRECYVKSTDTRYRYDLIPTATVTSSNPSLEVSVEANKFLTQVQTVGIYSLVYHESMIHFLDQHGEFTVSPVSDWAEHPYLEDENGIYKITARSKYIQYVYGAGYLGPMGVDMDVFLSNFDDYGRYLFDWYTDADLNKVWRVTYTGSGSPVLPPDGDSANPSNFGIEGGDWGYFSVEVSVGSCFLWKKDGGSPLVYDPTFSIDGQFLSEYLEDFNIVLTGTVVDGDWFSFDIRNDWVLDYPYALDDELYGLSVEGDPDINDTLSVNLTTPAGWRELIASDVVLNSTQRLDSALATGYQDPDIFLAQKVITKEYHDQLEIEAQAQGKTIAEYLNELFPNTIVWIASEET